MVRVSVDRRLSGMPRSSRGDMQIYHADGELYVFNRKTGELWRHFMERRNAKLVAEGMQPVRYYEPQELPDAAASPSPSPTPPR